MFLIFINLVIFFCTNINGNNIEFEVEPRTSCGESFCETINNYPIINITNLIINQPSFIQRIQEIQNELDADELSPLKSRERTLCNCKPKFVTPLVGLNAYNTPRFIVNIDQYKQKFKSCSLNLTNEEVFQNTLCADITPQNSAHKPMCLPKYQNVILNVIKNEKLYLDVFNINSMYTCVILT